MEFSSLCNEFRLGDSRIEVTIFDRLHAPLLRLVKSHLSKNYQSKVSAEDIVQSTFFSFVRRHRKEPFQIENVEVMWSIMAKIAIRKCKNEIRKYQRAKRDIKKEVNNFRNSAEHREFKQTRMVSREPNPQRKAESQDNVNRILGLLKPQQREMVKLRLNGYSFEEIAKQMKKSERTIYRMLDQVRFHIIRLQQLLENSDAKLD